MLTLDTDLLSLLIRKNNRIADHLRHRIDQAEDRESATTVISYEEQMRGWLSLAAKARSVSEQIVAYGRLCEHVEFYRFTRVLPFDERAAVEFQRLRGLSIRIGTMDLKIASIALSQKATLLSRNLRDFNLVPGLDVQDWSS